MCTRRSPRFGASRTTCASTLRIRSVAAIANTPSAKVSSRAVLMSGVWRPFRPCPRDSPRDLSEWRRPAPELAALDGNLSVSAMAQGLSLGPVPKRSGRLRGEDVRRKLGEREVEDPFEGRSCVRADLIDGNRPAELAGDRCESCVEPASADPLGERRGVEVDV